MRILIVEDHEATAASLRKLLAEKIPGVVCRTVATLQEGLDCAKEFGANVTLLDLGLPDVARDQVIASIPLFPPPVICLTEMDDPDFIIEMACYDNMAQNFFSKKFLRTLIFGYGGDKLVEAIMKAHWRHARPSEQAKRLHAQATKIEQVLHEQPR